MNYELLLQKYRQVVDGLRNAGANEDEIKDLAGPLAAGQNLTDHENSEDAAIYRQLKTEGVPYAYFYGSFVIEKLTIVSNSNVGLKMGVRIPVGHRPAKIEFEGYQAIRILSLIKSKFDNFEQDVRQGFLYAELEKSDQDIITRKKLSLDYESIPDGRELNRAIKDKLSQKVEQNQIIERLNPEGAQALVRLGFSPSRVIFQSAKIFEQFEQLTDQSFLKFSERYNVRLPY